MKNMIKISALFLALVFALTIFVGCGKSMDSIKEKIKDLDEDDYGYEKYDKEDRKDFKSEVEDDLDVDFDGSIETIYEVWGEDDEDDYAIIVEFEKASDAKAFKKAMIEYLEDEGEDSYVEISGKIVILADSKDILKEIWN